jgi:hypothetical protein
LPEGNAVLIDRENLNQHLVWIVLAGALTVGAIAWYATASAAAPRWPGGSSAPGFAFGVAGGLIILFEFLLWPRKKVRAWRLAGSSTGWRRTSGWDWRASRCWSCTAASTWAGRSAPC